jgi:hypothetical protein
MDQYHTNNRSWINYTNTFSNDGYVSFYWNVSSEANYDYLCFCQDKECGDTGCTCANSTLGGGSADAKITGSGAGWRFGFVNWSYTAGTHFFTWCYKTDGGIISGQNMGILDNVTFVTNSYAPSAPSWQTGLVSWWKFNGNPSDSIGTNHGTVNGATLTSTGCKSGQCYSFDGVNDYLNVPSSQFLPLIKHAYTISAWVNDNTTAATLISPFHRIISFANGTFNIQLGLAQGSVTTNRIFYIEESDQVNDAAKKGTAGNASNGWHHVVATSDGTTYHTYLDGVLSEGGQVSSGSTTFTTNTGLLYIGQRGDDGFVNGLIDEAMIWNRSLSASEISAIYSYTYP